ncbi:MAG: phosphotransferase [Anaerolineales bacterium]|nr:phosphotransferase [Anaerolineales bacterium]
MTGAPDPVLTDPAQATPEWLTAVLAASGALTAGRVTEAAQDGGRGNWSANARLALAYSPDAQGERPARLFLKLVNAALDDESFGDSEVTYYTRDYVDAPDAPLLPCYAAAYSPTARRYHLLLADVTETHTAVDDRPPTLEYGLALAEALAALHAHWWGAERLAAAGAPPHSAAHVQAFIDVAAPGVVPIVAGFSGGWPAHWPAQLRAAFDRLPALLARRAAEAQGQTLIHGDVGPGNILVPRTGDRPLYLIDRQPFNWSLTTWLGAYDLAYALVLDWEPDTRRACETPVLRRYHAELLRRGVTGYGWEQLWDDYRLCAAMSVYIPVEYCRGGVDERWVPVWRPMLERALAAADDLDCAALWGENLGQIGA